MSDSAVSKEEVNRRAKERKEQSQDAMNYFNEHKVARTIQNLLNQMFLNRPDDINGYMARYLTSLAKAPSIHHFEVEHAVDSNCNPATKVSLFAKINGQCQKLADSIVSDYFGGGEISEESMKNNLTPSKSSITAGQQHTEESSVSLETSTLSVSDEKLSINDMTQRINPVLEGRQLNKLGECLDVLSEKPISHLKPSLMLAVSLSIISGLSISAQIPLYEVIAGLNSEEAHPQSEFAPPVPMYHILNGTGGKCKLADFYLTISPNVSIIEGIKYAQALFDKLRQSIKISSLPMTDGALRHSIDKLEQGYDLINEAGKGLDLNLGEDAFLILNSDADKRWDGDKNKYEVASGQWKSSTELIEYYNEVTRAHPNILLGIINAFHEQDYSGYATYNKNHPSTILFINNVNIIEKVREKLKGESEPETEEIGHLNSFVSSKHLELPLKEWIYNAKRRDSEETEGLGFAIQQQEYAEEHSSFSVDLITGVNGSFIQVGSPRDKGTSLSINRLVEIEQELKEGKRLKVNTQLTKVFSSIIQ